MSALCSARPSALNKRARLSNLLNHADQTSGSAIAPISDFCRTKEPNTNSIATKKGELGKLFIKHGFLGKRFDGQRNAGVIGKACWRLGYLNSTWGGGSAYYFDTACTYAEYPPTVCRIDQPALEINHGTLTPREVNGNSAYTDFYVTCSSAMFVYVISPTQINSVILSPASGLRSDITINDRKLGDGVGISASTSPTRLRITSTLNGFNSQLEGEFSGSFIIIIAPA